MHSRRAARLLVIALLAFCAPRAFAQTPADSAQGVLAPPPVAPMSVKTSTIGDFDPTVADSARAASLLIAPIPFYNSQLGAGLVGIVGKLKSLGPPSTTPPSFGGLMALATTNGTWGVAGAGRAHLSGDTWRMLAFGGWMDLRYSFYGVGGPGENEASVTLRQTMSPFVVEGLRRVAPSLYLGGRALYNRVEIGLDDDALPPEIAGEIGWTDPFVEVALAPRLQLDSRDDQMYPTRGVLVDATASYLSDAWGSDSTMQNYTALVTYQRGWDDDQSVVAAACQVCASSGEVPIDQMCFVGAISGLRGYEAGKYLDRSQLTVQAEYRRKFGRLGFTAFTGAAQTAPSLDRLDGENVLFAGGVGARYQLLTKFPLNYRVDVAFGRDGAQLYFSLGEAF